MSITEPVYCTREMVMSALDTPPAAGWEPHIDRVIAAGARAVEGIAKRTFYPWVGTKWFDWPNWQTSESWRLYLYANDLHAVTSLTTGGTSIPVGNLILEPNWDGPPYTSIQVNLGTQSSFSAGTTFQQAIAVTGTWGYLTDPQPYAAAANTSTVMTSSSATVTVTATGGIGTGSILQVDNEIMLVTGRGWALATTASAVTASMASTIVTVASVAGIMPGDVILIDAERMLVTDVAGSNLIVVRAYGGTQLAAHALSASVYAQWVLTVQRGTCGTTAAAHTSGSPVLGWVPPSLVAEYNVGYALNALMTDRSGMARVIGQGASGVAVQATRRPLDALGADVYSKYGRQARTRAV